MAHLSSALLGRQLRNHDGPSQAAGEAAFGPRTNIELELVEESNMCGISESRRRRHSEDIVHLLHLETSCVASSLGRVVGRKGAPRERASSWPELWPGQAQLPAARPSPAHHHLDPPDASSSCRSVLNERAGIRGARKTVLFHCSDVWC